VAKIFLGPHGYGPASNMQMELIELKANSV